MIHRPLACQLIFVLRHSGSDHSHAPRGIFTFIFQRLHLAWRYRKKTCFSPLTAFTKRARNWEREKFAKHCFHIHYFLAGGTSSKSQRTGISFGMLFYLHCLLASVDKGWTKFVLGAAHRRLTCLGACIKRHREGKSYEITSFFALARFARSDVSWTGDAVVSLAWVPDPVGSGDDGIRSIFNDTTRLPIWAG